MHAVPAALQTRPPVQPVWVPAVQMITGTGGGPAGGDVGGDVGGEIGTVVAQGLKLVHLPL